MYMSTHTKIVVWGRSKKFCDYLSPVSVAVTKNWKLGIFVKGVHLGSCIWRLGSPRVQGEHLSHSDEVLKSVPLMATKGS